MKNIVAYLIDSDKIQVIINNKYYNGECTNILMQIGNKNYEMKELDVTKNEEITTYNYQVAIDVDYTKEVTLFVNNGLATPLNVDKMTKTAEFEEKFYYDGDDLGVTYTKEMTQFKVWSPTATQVKLEVVNNTKTETFEMIRGAKGVWSMALAGDYELAQYAYLLKINGVWRESTDPYAYSCTPNGEKSVVIDLEKTKVELNKEIPTKLENYTDSIVYEMHVRDFSVDASSNIKNKGKFMGVIEEGVKTNAGNLGGLDYLVDLGVTHLQFLPIYDFGSVDEKNQFDFYNWGYDPEQYNIPEGSYSTDVFDPYSRVIELKKMNAKIHEKGLRTIMDTVYNHMFDVNSSQLNKVVPGYYFRYDDDFNLSNGSFCGNDVESNSKMGRKYIIDSCLRYINFYGFDGFRFDLMGILDIETMNELRSKLDEIDPSIMLFGEGWHMPTTLDDDLQASMRNDKELPRIGHFNDKYRNNVKDYFIDETKTQKISKKEKKENQLRADKDFAHCLLGTTVDYDGAEPYLNDIQTALSYIECHDNHTYYDYIVDKMFNEEKATDEEEILIRHRMATTTVLLSQGITFIHAGQEFYRTKNGVENSYKSNDEVNKFDWTRKDQYIDYVNYFKQLVAIRKSFAGFKLPTNELILENTTIVKLADNVIQYTIKYNNEEYVVVVNNSAKKLKISLENEYKLLVDSSITKADINGLSTHIKNIKLNPYSVNLLKTVK